MRPNYRLYCSIIMDATNGSTTIDKIWQLLEKWQSKNISLYMQRTEKLGNQFGVIIDILMPFEDNSSGEKNVTKIAREVFEVSPSVREVSVVYLVGTEIDRLIKGDEDASA